MLLRTALLEATDLARLLRLGRTTHPTAAITRGQTPEPKVTIVSSIVPPSGASGLMMIPSMPARESATTCCNFFDGSGEGQRVDMAIGDQWQQRQIRGDTGGVRDRRNSRQRLYRKREPLHLKGPCR